MKPETLDALLLDRAIGELPAEVAELLETHLARDPDAARQAEKLAATIQLARQAVAMAPEQPRRPLAVERLRRVRTWQRRWSMTWGIARLAASVAIGLALGWYGRVLVRGPGLVEPAAITRAARAFAATARPEAETGSRGFWSQSGVWAAAEGQQAAERRATSRYRLRWESPVKMPTFEEDL
jgi:anti-sigma factor RsiW